MNQLPLVIDLEDSDPLPTKKVHKDTFISFKPNTNNNLTIKPHQIAPWITKSTREIKDTLLRFHNEIIEFYQYVSPTQQSHQIRLNLFKKLKAIIEEVLPNAKVKSFGSFKTKLYLPDSDMDIAVLINSQQDDRQIYSKLYRHLKKYNEEFKQMQYISRAKVPIIKFVDSEYGISFDVSVNKQDGLQQIEHVERALKIFPQMKYMMFVMKYTLKIRGMAQPFTGGIGSFLLFCMILVYLRDVHSRNKYYLISEHILKFLQFYSMGKMDRMTAYVRDNMLVQRQKQPLTISIKSPQDETHDIGRSAFNSRDILKMFKNRYRMIINYNFAPSESILKQLVNPNGDKFKYQKRK